MAWVGRDAVGVAPDRTARLLQPLLVPVVTRLAQRLVIGRVPEQLVIPFVRNNVIDDRCRRQTSTLLALNTERVFAQVPFPIPLPARVVATLR